MNEGQQIDQPPDEGLTPIPPGPDEQAGEALREEETTVAQGPRDTAEGRPRTETAGAEGLEEPKP